MINAYITDELGIRVDKIFVCGEDYLNTALLNSVKNKEYKGNYLVFTKNVSFKYEIKIFKRKFKLFEFKKVVTIFKEKL